MVKNNKSPSDANLTGNIPADCAAALVYTTFPDLAAAERAGRYLVESRLAGCVNILPGMVSLYVWQGQLERSEEVVLLAKTTTEGADICIQAIVQNHPYETPAVIVLPVAAGATGYLDWLKSGIGPPL